MTSSKRKWRKRLVMAGVTAAVVVLVVFPAYLLLQVLVVIPYRHEHGQTYLGASAKFRESLDIGDTERAKYWAERMIVYSQAGRERAPWARRFGMAFFAHPYYSPESTTNAYRCLAQAHELAGALEEALRSYKIQAAFPLGIGRVCYKLGREEESFQAFCAYAFERRRERHLSISPALSANAARAYRRDIVGPDYQPPGFEHELSPFPTYSVFLSFMEKQWETTGYDDAYREPMEFLRAMSGEPTTPNN
jgi:hypothetical protein